MCVCVCNTNSSIKHEVRTPKANQSQSVAATTAGGGGGGGGIILTYSVHEIWIALLDY